jgi:hypothetical protein
MPPLFQRVSRHFQALEKQKNIIGAKELHSLESDRDGRLFVSAHAPRHHVRMCLDAKKDIKRQMADGAAPPEFMTFCFRTRLAIWCKRPLRPERTAGAMQE